MIIDKFNNNPRVLGFDIINEPLGGNFYVDYSLVAPGQTDSRLLQPLYQNFYEQLIRPRVAQRAQHQANNDPQKGKSERMLFFMPQQVPSILPILGGIVFHAGFWAPPEGSALERARNGTKLNSVLNDHTYCCQAFPCDPFGTVYD